MSQSQPRAALSSDAVREQLHCLLQSQDLHVSPRLKSLLVYLVEETLNGRAGNIKAYTIAVEALGRNENFNPNLDPIVRVEAGKLRRQLELYYLLNPNDPVHIVIPLGGYVPVFNLTGQQDAPLAAPPPPKPLNPQDDAATSPSDPAPDTALKKERRPILGLVPFSFIGKDSALEYFVKGLTESILVEMAHSHDVDPLEALAPSTSQHDILDTVYRAKELGARFILHGLAQREHSSLRIYAALTDTHNARRIWTEKFDTPFEENNLLQVQDTVTSWVTGRVTDAFGLINRTLLRETAHKDLEKIGVYEATLRYHAWIGTFDRNDYLTAKQALEHSYAHVPDNAMVCALLSDIYSADFEFGYDLLENNLDLGLELSIKSLTLDSSCQMAHWAMALNYQLRGDISRMFSSINKIYPSCNTNPYLCVSVGLLTGMSKDLAEGKRLVAEALRLNPYSPSWCHIVPFMYYYSKENYEAALNEALQMNVPSCIWDPIARAAAYGKLGCKEEAQKALERVFVLDADFLKKRDRILQSLLVCEKWMRIINEGLSKAGLNQILPC